MIGIRLMQGDHYQLSQKFCLITFIQTENLLLFLNSTLLYIWTFYSNIMKHGNVHTAAYKNSTKKLFIFSPFSDNEPKEEFSDQQSLQQTEIKVCNWQVQVDWVHQQGHEGLQVDVHPLQPEGSSTKKEFSEVSWQIWERSCCQGSFFLWTLSC